MNSIMPSSATPKMTELSQTRNTRPTSTSSKFGDQKTADTFDKYLSTSSAKETGSPYADRSAQSTAAKNTKSDDLDIYDERDLAQDNTQNQDDSQNNMLAGAQVPNQIPNQMPANSAMNDDGMMTDQASTNEVGMMGMPQQQAANQVQNPNLVNPNQRNTVKVAQPKLLNEQLVSANLDAAAIFINPLFSMPDGSLESYNLAINGQEANGGKALNPLMGYPKPGNVLNQNQINQNLKAGAMFVLPTAKQNDASLGKLNVASNLDQQQLDADLKISQNANINHAAQAGNLDKNAINQLAAGESDRKKEKDSFDDLAPGLTADNRVGISTKSDQTIVDKMSSNWQSFENHLRSTLSSGGNQLRLKLNPAELGSLDFTLHKKAGGITADLTTDNKDLVDYLKGQVDRIRSILVEQGIKIDSLTLNYQNTSNTNSTNLAFSGDQGGGAFQQNSGQNQQRSVGGLNSAESGATQSANNSALDINI